MKGIVFTNSITPRLQYITDFISDTFFGKQLQLTDNIELYKNFEGFIVNYSDKRIFANELFIQPIELLFEKGITQQTIECFEWQGLKVFFKTAGDIPFDVFAASFYLLSRYEEYLPHTKDEYGRYAHINSLAFQNNFVHLPLINLWFSALRSHLLPHNPHLSTFCFLPTYDVDIAYNYKAKGFIKNSGNLFKEVLTGKWQQAKERIQVLLCNKQDPFDTSNWLHALHAKYSLQPVYFFLMAQKNKEYDKNILPRKKALQQLIIRHANNNQIGIHPSWQSGDNKAMLQQEIHTLQRITQQPVTQSRQHYIRMNLPDTYRLLLKAGITKDYSMGYGSINGFRASVVSPCYWYDVEKEEATKLIIFPFCYMDANSFFEQHYSANQAAEELQYYHDIVKQVNGTFITIFHNHFVTRQPQWRAWRNMYAEFLEKNFKYFTSSQPFS